MQYPFSGETLARSLVDAITDASPRRATFRAVERLFAGSAFSGFPGGAGRVLLSGFGKCAAPMAAGALDALGDRVSGGVLTGPFDLDAGRGVTICASSHPFPDERTVRASERVLEFFAGAGPNDLILCLASGGGSSMLEVPGAGLTIDDIALAGKLLLSSGAGIAAVNAVRRALSAVKAGGLLAATRAKVLTLAVSDVIDGGPETIASGPTWPEPADPAGALAVIREYGISNNVSGAVLRFLENAASRSSETESRSRLRDSMAGAFAGYEVIADWRALAEAASTRLEAVLGSRPAALGPLTSSTGEAAWTLLDAAAEAVRISGRTACAVAAGELSVRLPEGAAFGKGGRNQQFILECAVRMADRRYAGLSFAAAAVASDGIEAGTDAAGAFVASKDAADGGFAGAAAGALSRYSAYGLLDGYGLLVRTGPTGNNLNDIMAVAAFPCGDAPE